MTISRPPSSHPTPRTAPERGLRRLDRALATLLADREAVVQRTSVVSYIDFSELYAFAFRLDAEKPSDDFAGGRYIDDATSTWMLSLATEHLFKDWDASALRMLPPHRAEMTGEFHRYQERIRSFHATRQRVLEAFPPQFRVTLAAVPEAERHALLLQLIMQGHLSTLCMDLLEREREVDRAGRSFTVIRRLLDSKKLDLSDGIDIADYQPTYEELVPVENAISHARRAEGSTNATDARALLYLRKSVLALDGRVRFTSRSGAVRRALNELARRPDDGHSWVRVGESLRVPEAVLLDFLAGPDSEGTEWLGRLRTLLDQFLAQVDRAHSRDSDPDRELTDITGRAWEGLVGALNLRRATREDAPMLLAKCATVDSSSSGDFSRLAKILMTPEFHTETGNRINALLDSIERAEWRIALTVNAEEAENRDVPVRISRSRGNTSVSFTSGDFQVSLNFMGEIGATLRGVPAQRATPQTLIDTLLQSESAHGAEAYLLIAAILGTLSRWSDAALYCSRAIDASTKNTEATREARFFRGLCLRQVAQASGLDSDSVPRLLSARGDVDSVIATPGRQPDARYLKELGTIILVWVDQQLPQSPGWTLADALTALEAAKALVGNGAEDRALSADILNNLCYAFALSPDEQLTRGLQSMEQLEALVGAQGGSSLAYRDTGLLLRARDARIKRDLARLEQLREEFQRLVAIAEPREGTMEARQRHLQEVSNWCAELAPAHGATVSPPP